MVIGSTAIKYHFPDFPREPKDLDLIGFGKNKNGIEFHRNPVLESKMPGFSVCPANDLYTLKVSHCFWDIKWEKHMFDIQFMKAKGCELNPYLFNELYAYWCSVHELPTRSKLNMSAKDFFDNALSKYDHDFLHALISPTPMYKSVLREGAEVEVSDGKFKALTHNQKLELVREEIYVMAYERMGDRSYRSAYAWMLKKFIIHHAPIWEAVWIIQNYKELHKPMFNYKTKLDYELRRIESTN